MLIWMEKMHSHGPLDQILLRAKHKSAFSSFLLGFQHHYICDSLKYFASLWSKKERSVCKGYQINTREEIKVSGWTSRASPSPEVLKILPPPPNILAIHGTSRSSRTLPAVFDLILFWDPAKFFGAKWNWILLSPGCCETEDIYKSFWQLQFLLTSL